MNYRKAKLLESLHRSMKLDVQFNTFTNVLVNLNGYYSFADPIRPVCHPLETLLLGLPVAGDWCEDVAAVLGVDIEWVDGVILWIAGRKRPNDSVSCQSGYDELDDSDVFRMLYHQCIINGIKIYYET